MVDSLQLDYFDEDTRRQCFNLTVIDDRFFEARESLKVVVYLNPYESPPALELTPNKAVVEIVDNDREWLLQSSWWSTYVLLHYCGVV